MSLDLQGRVEEVAEGRSSDGRSRLFFARSENFDARKLYAEPWNDVDWIRRNWTLAVERRLRLCRELGTRLCLLLPPDAHAVHADELPEGFAFATPSLGDRFAELWGSDGELNLIYPREELRGARGPVDVYRRTDSHWTSLGAYAAYRMVMGRIGQGARVLGPDDFHYRWREETGDLGWALEPPRTALVPRAVIDQPRARCTVERYDERRHGLKVFEVDDPSLPTCLVARDSFATDMGPFLSESFRRTVIVGADDRFFPEILYEERPDVVIIERAERALRFGVLDWGLTTWREAWPEPGDAEAHALDLEARRRMDGGLPNEALALAQDAVARDPTPDRRFTLGRACLAVDDAEGALDAFDAARAGDPARWAFLLHAGIARLRLNRFDEARDLFARACATAPWHPFGFEHFGFACMALGDMAAAEPALRTSIRLAPENAGAHVWLVRLLHGAGRVNEAHAAAGAGAAVCQNDPVLQGLATGAE